MATLTERGEVTFQEDVLRHLDMRPGETVTRDLLPGGRAELRAEPKGSWDDPMGFLEGRTNGARLSIAEAGAAAGRGEP